MSGSTLFTKINSIFGSLEITIVLVGHKYILIAFSVWETPTEHNEHFRSVTFTHIDLASLLCDTGKQCATELRVFTVCYTAYLLEFE